MYAAHHERHIRPRFRASNYLTPRLRRWFLAVAKLFRPCSHRFYHELADAEGSTRVAAPLEGGQERLCSGAGEIIGHKPAQLQAIPLKDTQVAQQEGQAVWAALALPPTIHYHLVGGDLRCQATQRRRQESSGRRLPHGK